jgi:hypothetical protein
MIFELRIYTIYPGKLENIKRRFEDKALAQFEKHNMVILDFWQDIKDEKIFYLMQHEDVDTRNRDFDSFLSDPDWLEIKRVSELDGPIVEKVESYLMTRLPFSPAK